MSKILCFWRKELKKAFGKDYYENRGQGMQKGLSQLTDLIDREPI